MRADDYTTHILTNLELAIPMLGAAHIKRDNQSNTKGVQISGLDNIELCLGAKFRGYNL